MASNRNQRRYEAASRIFTDLDSPETSNPSENVNQRNTGPNKQSLWNTLWKLLVTEQSKWWEATTQKYIEVNRIPRGLRIYTTPTFADPDPDMVEEWAGNSHECSMRMLKILVKDANKRCEKLAEEIEAITNQLKSLYEDEKDFESEMAKFDTKLEKLEKEIRDKKESKFLRDRNDYEQGQVLTFAKRYDHLRTTITTREITPLPQTEGTSVTTALRDSGDTREQTTAPAGPSILKVQNPELMSPKDKILMEYAMVAQRRLTGQNKPIGGTKGRGQGGKGAGKSNTMNTSSISSPVGSRTRGQRRGK
ncbi:uncharacterized protein LOC144791801 [Lissotriton helveticus]